MAKLTVEEQKEFTLFPKDSILLLKVDELSTQEIQGKHGPWEKLEIKFKILGIEAVGDGSDPAGFEDIISSPIWGSVPLKLTTSPENKLRLWAEAILGMDLGIGFELDTDMFASRICRGVTSQYEKRSKDAQGNPFKGHQVDFLLPAPNHATGAAAAQQQYAAQPPNPAYQQPQGQPQTGYQQAVAAQGQPAADPWGTQQTFQQPGNDPWGTPGSQEPPF